MYLKKEQAIVIQLQPYKETSKLVTFWGADKGKFFGIVRGASRLKGKWGGKLDLFYYGEVLFSSKKDSDLVTVTDFLIEESFYSLRENLDKLKLASYFTKLLGLVTDIEPRPLFVLLLSSLYYLKEAEDFSALSVYFDSRLLYLLGIYPSLECCISCRNKLLSPKLFFSINLGGELCPKCAQSEVTSLYNRSSLNKLTEIVSLSLEKLPDYSLNKAELKEIKTFCNRYLLYHLGSDIKSQVL